MTTPPALSSATPIRRTGSVDVLGTISSLLAGYSGGITIVRELAQNTDDVPGDGERWLELHFHPERLVVRNNTVFRDADFENIMRIARGGKQEEQRRTIGAFGVGFVSVYQLTDTPIVRSADRELHMMPGLDGFPIDEYPCEWLDETEFTLPYRHRPTAVGMRLRMPHVTDTWVDEILRELPDETYRLLFFLRRLSRISVFRGDRLVSEVSRALTHDAGGLERLTITCRRGNAEPVTHTWLRFSGQVLGSIPTRSDNQPAKDRAVHIVVPDTNVPDEFLRDHLPGKLYNYLPTEIATGLPFQINGDFYPSTDRKGIDNDHPNSRDWNNRVLAAIGSCTAASLPILRTHFADAPLQLYRRIDIGATTELVAPISKALVGAARSIAIFKTSDAWRDRIDTRWIKPELRPLAYQMSPALMAAELQDAASTLLTKLDVREFTFGDVLDIIRREVAAGTQLADAPPYLRTMAQIEALYQALDAGLAQGMEGKVRQTPIFLDHTGRLWPADACVRSNNEELRKELAESGLHFWSFDPEHYRLAASLVPSFKLDHLWSELRRQIPGETLLADAPEWLNSTTKLYRLYRTVLRTHEPVLKNSVVGLPICLNREGRLCRPDRLLLPDRDRILYELLADDQGAPLVAQPINDDKSYRGLYSDMGVPVFTIDDLFDRLGKLARDEVLIADAHPCLNNRDKLLRLYRFLRDSRAELETKHIEALRHRLPIWHCRDGYLRRAKDRALPPDVTNLPSFITVNHVLDLEGGDHLRSFLAEVIQLRPLGVEQFIIQALVPQFGGLERKYQLEALRFMRDHATALLRENAALRETLKQTPLIYGDDDRLHRPIDLCFPRASCRGIFPDRFSEPHRGFYAVPTSGDFSGWIWYGLFELLGVNRTAPFNVVLDEVRRLIARPSHQTRESIEKIFRYIEDNWDFYRSTPLIRTLRDMAWLPAEGDETYWYRPTELYPRQDKPLIDRVARVIGFGESRIRAFIAEALGFPTTVPVEKVVQQLLVLSERDEPASKYIYQALGRAAVTPQQLKPLIGRPVIYDDKSQRYWKPEQIFLSNQRKYFGSYRGYASNSEFRSLFEQLGARDEPSFKDFVTLLLEISSTHRENLPSEDVVLVRTAYERLANAPDVILASLQSIPCVLTDGPLGDRESFSLRLPESAILMPPDEFRQLLPELPIAVYTPAGEPTLRALGVRTIAQVLRIEHLLQPSFQQPIDLVVHFASLARAIRRLLFHYDRSLEHELPIIEQQLSGLRGYWQDGIQIVCHVELGRETYTSQPAKRQSLYLAESGHVYLDRRLDESTLHRELARVLSDILQLRDGHQSLLKELIENARNAMEILDYNNIKSLPIELDLAPVVEDGEGIQVGSLIDADDPFDTGAASASGRSDVPRTPEEQLDGSLFDAPVERHSKATGDSQPAGSDAVEPPRQARSSEQESSTPPTRHSGTNGRKPSGNGSSEHGRSSSSAGTTSPDRGTAHGESTGDRGLGGGSKSRSAGGSTADMPSHSSPSSARRPSPDPAAPAFAGTVVNSSPALPTDYDGLRDRVRRWAAEIGQSLTEDAAPVSAPSSVRRTAQRPAVEQRNVARFVLSFPEVRDGFVRLTNSHARSLFQGSPSRVDCRTDAGTVFPLWLDWQRDVPIAYNQEALGTFFAAESIPAGGIVYLQREHDETFRLYYHHMPHVVPEVRIAFNEQGEVRYETHDTEVMCETDDAVYRAERRFEDQAALMLEAVGKKSVEETLCDLLMSGQDQWRHEDELKAMVAAVRMVAESTVLQTLRAKPFFEHDGQGYWRLNPAKVLAHARDDAVVRWQRATKRLLASDDMVLGEALPALRPPLNELTDRLIQVEAALAPAVTAKVSLLTFIQQLNEDPSNRLLTTSLTRAIQERVSAADVDLALDGQLRAALNAANDAVWSNALRPALRQQCTRLRSVHEYQRALELARSWSDYDQHHGIDLAELGAEARAAQLVLTATPTLTDTLHAVDIAPNLALVREKLHVAAQAALRHDPGVFLAAGANERAVDAFFAHVAAVSVARPKLERASVPAFDRTVLEEARQLWLHLPDAAQIRLLLWLPRYIDPRSVALTAQEMELLVQATEQHNGTRVGLLIGLAAWKLCPSGHALQHRLADQLAYCHIKMEIWEKANNRPWKQFASERLCQELRRGCQMNSTTLMSRERRLLALLQEPDLSPLGITLEAERTELYQRYEHEYQRLLESAA